MIDRLLNSDRLCTLNHCDTKAVLKNVTLSIPTLLLYVYSISCSSVSIATIFPPPAGISLFLTPAYIVGTYNFPIPGGFAGELFCRIVGSYYLVFTLGIVSVYTVTCLALERWFAVTRPAQYKSRFKKRRVYTIMLCIWLVSFSFNAPQLFEMKLGPDNQCIWISLTEGTLRKVVAFVEFMGKFFIPLLATTVFFANLCVRVKKSPALFQTNQGRAGIRLLRMCSVTALILGVCWFPNQLYYLLFKFDITTMDTPLHHFTVVLCMGNSCVNPIVYCITNKTYRRLFRRLLCPWNTNEIVPLNFEASAGHMQEISGVRRVQVAPNCTPRQVQR